MILRRLLTITILLTSTIWSQAQQINPVPDYVFRNQMSVGRNAVTDTAAYFSIGPRYGATKGFMPPIVGDTATFSSGKRNGLLIFSVQKNKFLYWDSVRVQWSDMAGSSGAYIVAGDTASMLAPYLRKVDTTSMLTAYLRKGDTTAMLSPYYRSATASAALALKLNISDTSSMLGNYVRHAGYGLTKSGQSLLVDTLNIATRAWRQKGLDSLAALEVSGSGTTNYVPKFTASTTIGNSQIFDNGTNVGIGTTSPSVFVHVQKNQNAVTTLRVENTDTTSSGARANISVKNVDVDYHITSIGKTGAGINAAFAGTNSNHTLYLMTNGTARQTIFANGRIGINTTTDAGYQLDVNGTLRSVNGANFATTSGNVGIGTASPTSKLDVVENAVAINQLRVGQDAVHKVMIGAETNFAEIQAIRVGVDFNKPLVLQRQGGNVGVGTSLPTTYAGYTTLAVNNATNGGVIDVLRNNSLILQIFGDAGASGIGSIANVPFTFKTNSIEQGRINTAGEFLLNSTNSDAGDYKLQVSGNIYNTGSAVLAATGGEVLVGTTTDRGAYKLQVDGLSFFGSDANSYALLNNTASNAAIQAYGAWTNHLRMTYPAVVDFDFQITASGELDLKRSSTVATRVNAARELMINTTTDAGDYHLQVVGNARIGTGKLDIASNTVYGLGVARSGTSEVAGQIYNSNGILYLGAESSAGGQIFSGSSAYAAVIGSGANYPLQFAANNITRATLTTNGNFMIGFPTDTYFYRLQVNGSIFSNNQIIAQNAAAQLNIDSSTNISPLYISNQSLTGSSAQGLFYGSTTWNTTGNPSLIDLAITNTASGSDANYIKISDGSNIFRVTKAAEVVTAAPTGGSIRKWKLGEAATVSPTSPNRTIRVEIDGTVYYLHAKTTND